MPFIYRAYNKLYALSTTYYVLKCSEMCSSIYNFNWCNTITNNGTSTHFRYRYLVDYADERSGRDGTERTRGTCAVGKNRTPGNKMKPRNQRSP